VAVPCGRNARAIGELFAAQAGKFVSSARGALGSGACRYGSGAAARSIRESARVMNVRYRRRHVKIALCEGGEVIESPP